jgi:hypothetical protein
MTESEWKTAYAACLECEKITRWTWVRLSLIYAANIVVIWGIYALVVHSQFETVAVSILLLTYLEVVTLLAGTSVDSLLHRDHWNAVYRRLVGRFEIASDEEYNEAAIELAAKTAAVQFRTKVTSVANSVLWLIVLILLLRAVFFWS